MQKMKIYIATSWKNLEMDALLTQLRAEGYECYDFRTHGFQWSQVLPTETIDADTFNQMLGSEHPATDAFVKDHEALEECDALVLMLPCGKSAHLELGYCAGKGVPTAIFQPQPTQPELMYGLADTVVSSLDQLLHWLEQNRPVEEPVKPLPFRPAPAATPMLTGTVKLPGYNFGVEFDLGDHELVRLF